MWNTPQGCGRVRFPRYTRSFLPNLYYLCVRRAAVAASRRGRRARRAPLRTCLSSIRPASGRPRTGVSSAVQSLSHQPLHMLRLICYTNSIEL